MWVDVLSVLLDEDVVTVLLALEHVASLPQSVEIAQLGVAVYLAVEHAVFHPHSVEIYIAVVDKCSAKLCSVLCVAFLQYAVDVVLMLFSLLTIAFDAGD